MQTLEYTRAGDTFRDFCLWEYTPKVSSENKLRSSNLLFHSFEVAGADPRAHDLVRTIREGIGLSNTVWGVKRLGDEIRWEYYFYDYRRRGRERSMKGILEVIRPFIACDVRTNERFHYFMFSLDISDELLSRDRALEEIHMYIGNPGSTVSSGICYRLARDEMSLENFYFFFDAKREAGEILAKASCSAFIDERVGIDRIVWPEMRDCKVIVVANKQQNDAVYFSGIDVDQLLLFLTRMAYPRELIAFIEENRSLLDHLQYDVGYDYRMEGSDLVILKSGYYGIF